MAQADQREQMRSIADRIADLKEQYNRLDRLRVADELKRPGWSWICCLSGAEKTNNSQELADLRQQIETLRREYKKHEKTMNTTSAPAWLHL